MNDSNIFNLKSEYSNRLDIVLSDSLNKSRNYFRKLIKDGFVTVNGNIVRKTKFKVNKDDLLEYRDFKYVDDISNIIPQKIKIDIIYEDENVLVINKKAGIVVHPGTGNSKNTLLNGIIFKLKFDNILTERPGVVHRLDKHTSGVIIFAKNIETSDFLIEQFKNREVEKKYIALAKGIITSNNKKVVRMDDRNFYIKGKIERSHSNRKLFILSDKGKDAITYFKIIKYIDRDFTLLEVYPKTGRTHQIRVSLANINHPVVGDKLYSRKSIAYPHMFLHAYSLKLKLPNVGYKEFNAKLPNFWRNIPGVSKLYK